MFRGDVMQMFILVCITMRNCAMLQGFQVSAMHGSRPRFIPGESEVKRDWGQKTSRERLFQPMNDHQSAPIYHCPFHLYEHAEPPLPKPASRNILELLIYLPISLLNVQPSQLIYPSFLIKKQKLLELHKTKPSA
jgi:hypothetical protein